MPTFHFEQQFEILSFQVDPHGKLRWSALGDLFQEIAWQHADSADFGQQLFQLGFHWVLSRLHFEVTRFPAWGERVTVRTAARGIEGIFALREFEMHDSSDAALATGMSSWLLLDSESKRPKRPNLFLPAELFPTKSEQIKSPEKIPSTGEFEDKAHFRVLHSDLDMNNHVNNVTFIRWIEDYCLAHGRTFKRLEINFLAEAWVHQDVEVSAQTDGSGFRIKGEVGGAVIFTAITI